MSAVPAQTAANDAAPNRRQLAKAQTRAKVLDAGKSLFEEVGYERATIRAVARRIGMSTGAVFASFTDKAELYRAVYDHAPITPEQGLTLLAALSEAEAFMAGFEGDTSQVNIDALLWQARSALALTSPDKTHQSTPAAPSPDSVRMAA
ncbi:MULTISPECIES: TetR/AcrR family transcriptional regulator [unclassified Brevundimonas]|uniref:TetR/AcrR family transcriptional regulator n=1 Tax=unclassified Brevundimonas TaxID=2622653 RepID=UPI0039181838